MTVPKSIRLLILQIEEKREMINKGLLTHNNQLFYLWGHSSVGTWNRGSWMRESRGAGGEMKKKKGLMVAMRQLILCRDSFAKGKPGSRDFRERKRGKKEENIGGH